MRVLVIGPAGVPVIRDAEEAKASPELAVLSAVAHKDAPNAAKRAMHAVLALEGLTDEEIRVYSDWMTDSLGLAARLELQEMMMQKYEPRSEFFRKWYNEGKADGEKDGLAAGEARGLAEAVVATLETRAIGISSELRERIERCADAKILRRWLQHALTAADTDAFVAQIAD